MDMIQSLNEGISLLSLLDYFERTESNLEPAGAEQLLKLLDASPLTQLETRAAAFKDLVIFFDTLENQPAPTEEAAPPAVELAPPEDEAAATLYEWLWRTDFHQHCLAHPKLREENAQRWESLAQQLAGPEQRQAAIEALTAVIRQRLNAKL